MLKKSHHAVTAGFLAVLLTVLFLSYPSYAEVIPANQNPSREVIAMKLETIARSKGIPSIILKTIAYCETGWRQFDANGNVVTGGGSVTNPALGIMQITSYDPSNTAEVDKLKYDIDYNISRGADLLNLKWQNTPQIGDGDRNKLENWYFALWAYNGWSTYNNPNNAAARGEVSYQEAILRKAATAYFPGLTTPVQITPIPASLIPVDTLPNSSQTWPTPEPYHLGDLESVTLGTTTRIAGVSRIDTVNQVAMSGWANGAQTVIVTRSDAFPDGLAGVPLAKKYNAPILLTDSNQLDPGIISVLNTLRPSKVIILGGTQAISPSVEASLKTALTWTQDVTRIAGADRYQTAILIAQNFPAGSDVVIATGEDFPDALSLAAAAAANGLPLLLTKTQALPPVTQLKLKELLPGKIYLAGGEQAIAPGVVSQLLSTIPISADKIMRFAGANRYETSIMIANAFFPAANEVVIATGRDYADPLAAGALAASRYGCLLLVSPQGFTVNGPTETYLGKLASTTNVKVVGSVSTIPESAVTRVKYLLRQL